VRTLSTSTSIAELPVLAQGTNMKNTHYAFSSTVWLYPGMAGWHFMTIPEDVSEDIQDRFGDQRRGWGSLPVEVTIGATTWKTSIFPDTKTKAYVLPIKAEVRKKNEPSTVKSPS